MKAVDLANLNAQTIDPQWRVQSVNEYGANCVAYIDAREVMRVLDMTVGPANWQDDYREIGGHLFAGIGIRIGEEWVWKWDTGTESNIEKQKGLVSDSFKRAAVKWGVGRWLYDLPIERLPVEKKNGKNYPVADMKGKKKLIYSGEQLTAFINWKHKQDEAHLQRQS